MKIILALLIAFSFRLGYAQQSSPNYRFEYTGGEFAGEMDRFIINHKSFTTFLGNYMAKEYPSRHQLCSQGSFYIKFQIAYDGNIQNISATKGADSLVINLFKSSIKATEKYWKVTKPNQSEVLLLPIQYNYMAGCRNDNSVMQLQQTFVFDDGTPLSFLSCSVLSPLIQVVNKGQEELK